MSRSRPWLRAGAAIALGAWLLYAAAGPLMANLGYVELLKARAALGQPRAAIVSYDPPPGGDPTHLARAERLLELAAGLDPDDPSTLGGLGRVYGAMGAQGRAAEAWERAGAAGYDGFLTYTALGNLYAQGGEAERALGAWLRATPPGAASRIRVSRLIFAQGRDGYDPERWGDALRLLERAAASEPLSDEERAEVFVEMSDRLASLNRLEEAVAYAARAAEAAPTEPRLHGWHAWLLHGSGAPDEAAAAARRALALGGDWRAYQVLGDQALATCQIAQALQYYTVGMAAPSHGDWRHDLLIAAAATARWEQGDEAGAIAAWEQFLTRQPGFTTAAEQLAQAREGALERRCGA